MRRTRDALRGALLSLALLLTAGLLACEQTPDGPAPTSPDASRVQADAGSSGPGFAAAIRAQEEHTPDLLDRGGVVGTGVGLTDAGTFGVMIYVVRAEAAADLPDRLDDVPARAVVTGPIVADADETSRQRPAPLGFSVGHPDITAGTLGARVENGSGNLFILSNNHVLANSNQASIGDPTLQPGPSDGGVSPDDSLAALADYVQILFDGSTNYVDAAISGTASGNVGFTTSPEGYGTPDSVIVDLDGDGDPETVSTVSSGLVGTNVQKYGRTTGLTSGSIEEVNVSVNVCYECANPVCTRCASSAHFEDQLSITPGGFSDGGDSGALIVTDDADAQPVGLLFAGSDTRTLANRVDRALNAFGVDVDADSADGGDTGSGDGSTSDSTMHVGDLDGSPQNNGRTWNAGVTITVHDGSENTLSGVTVSGTWSGLGGGSADSSTCTTDTDGTCTVSASGMRKRNGSVTYTVDGLSDSLTYDSTDNHDPDGDTDGTSITVNKP